MQQDYEPSRLTGETSLNGPPARPRDVYKPGDDTRSLLGDEGAGPAGIGASTPGGRANAGVMMLMQGANEVQSVFPGHPLISQLIQIIQQFASDIPQAIAAMRQTVAPNQLLAAIGSTASGPTGAMGPAAAMSSAMPRPMPMGQQMGPM